MYDFSPQQRSALAKVPTLAANVALQRWVEVTHEGCHPYYRVFPLDGDVNNLAEAFEIVVRRNDVNGSLALVSRVSGALSAAKAYRDWQHNAVKTYVIDPGGKHTEQEFYSRLGAIARGQTSRPNDEPESVTLEWYIGSDMPASARLPFLGDVLIGSEGHTISKHAAAVNRENG